MSGGPTESAKGIGPHAAITHRVAAVVTGAVLAALAAAFCFALAAALQQREAGRANGYGVADPRLLWKLAHRPVWLAGIAADALSAALHVLALSLGSIALVQPLGVTGLLFAIPMMALLRHQRVRGRDLLAAVVVLSGLAVLLSLFPAARQSQVAHQSVVIGVVIGSVLLAVGAVGAAYLAPGRPRALLLAAGAGLSFGITAVLARALLELIGREGGGAVIMTAAVGIALLIPTGYLLLQNAYRAGHFAASLATAVVVDPLAAVLGGVLVLNEPLPQATGQAVTAILAAAAIIGGVAALVRSPAHLFTAVAADPEAAAGDGTPSGPGEARLTRWSGTAGGDDRIGDESGQQPDEQPVGE